MEKHISGTTKEVITCGAVVKAKMLDCFDGVHGSRTPRDQVINQKTEGQFLPATNRVITKCLA